MRIVEVFYKNGNTWVCCQGDDISLAAQYNRVRVGDRVYDTIGFSVGNSLSNRLQLFLCLSGNVNLSRNDTIIPC